MHKATSRAPRDGSRLTPDGRFADRSDGGGHLPRSEFQRPDRCLDRPTWVWADLGLWLLLGIAPLFLAGRHPVGQLAYVAAIGASVLGYLAWRNLKPSAAWVWSGSEWLLVTALLLVALQFTALPVDWVQRLSPGVVDYLPLWFDGSVASEILGGYQHLSMTPDATRSGFILLLALSTLFVVLLQRIRSIADVELMLHGVAAATVGIALLGLVQFLGGNGKFLWVYEHPFRDTLTAVKGPFTNENHFAHFLALGWGPFMFSCWRLAAAPGEQHPAAWRPGGRRPGGRPSGRRLTRHLACAFAAGAVGFAGLLTFSRGGVCVILVAAAVSGGLFARHGLVSRRVVRSGATILGVLAIALVIHGYQPLVRELGTLRVQSWHDLGETTGRLAIWSADWAAAKEFWLTGCGVGSHREVYPTFFASKSYVEFSHAESGYLQLLVETGVGGLALAIVALLTVVYRVHQTMRTRRRATVACGGAITASLLVSAVQSVWDFVWYIPACMTVVVVLAACICRLAQLVQEEGDATGASRIPPHQPLISDRCFGWQRWTATAVATVVVGMMLGECWPAARASFLWDAYFKQSQVGDPLELLADAPQVLVRPAGPNATSPVERLRENVVQLHEVLQRDPHHARACLQLAQSYLLLFEHRQRVAENPMPLSQIRDAALASQFPTQAAFNQWLQVVLGNNRRLLDAARNWAQRAVRLSPFQGEGYTYLADLAFLEIRDPAAKRAPIAQALRVRPFHGQVLLAAGNEAVLEGNQEAAVDYWKRAFHRQDMHKIQLIEMLGPRLSGKDFVAALDPDLDGLRYLYRYYVQTQRTADLKSMAPAYLTRLKADLLRTPTERRAPLWREASDLCHALHDETRSLACLEAALRHDPHDYETQRALALRLVAYQRYSAALAPLTWCQRRNADDLKIRDAIELATRQKLEMVK